MNCLAEWNHDPGCACLRTSLGCSLQTVGTLWAELYRGWPASAMWDDTGFYEHPMLGLHIDAPASSSLPDSLLPTPSASLPNDAETAETWLDRWEKHAGKTTGATRAGMPLGIAVQLLPTPTTSDAKGSRRATARTDEWTSNTGTTLLDAARLMPTPTSRDWKGRNQRNDDTCLPGAMALLPTPSAADSIRGADWSRVEREASGGDDLLTTIARLTSGHMRQRSSDGNTSSADEPPSPSMPTAG